MNLSTAAIGNYERGAREPGISELKILADFFDVSIDYLVGRTEDFTNINPKMKIIHYAVVETLKLPCSLKEKEIDMIIHILANGRKYSWYETEDRKEKI